MVGVAILRKEHAAKGFLRDLWQGARGGRTRAGRACPHCMMPMAAVAVPAGGIDLTLDVCTRCSCIWFDPGEYSQVPKTAAPSPEPAPRPALEPKRTTGTSLAALLDALSDGTLPPVAPRYGRRPPPAEPSPAEPPPRVEPRSAERTSPAEPRYSERPPRAPQERVTSAYARDAAARAEPDRARRKYRAEAGEHGPDERWKYIPALFGLPVECSQPPVSTRPWMTWGAALVAALVYFVASGADGLARVEPDAGTSRAHVEREVDPPRRDGHRRHGHHAMRAGPPR
ncbi:MAG: zf-TFIIB domain-containing protein, partial [Planctomycetota bacterium]